MWGFSMGSTYMWGVQHTLSGEYLHVRRVLLRYLLAMLSAPG